MHQAGDAPAARGSVGHVAAVADMLTAACLIGLDVIGAEDHAILFGDEGLAVRSHPVGERIGLSQIAIERIGFA